MNDTKYNLIFKYKNDYNQNIQLEYDWLKYYSYLVKSTDMVAIKAAISYKLNPGKS